MSMHSKFRPARLTALAGGAFAATMALAACGGGADTPQGAVENFLDNGMEDLAGAFAEGDFDKVVSISEEHFCESDVEGVKEMATMVEEMPDEEREAMMDGADDEFAIPEDWSYEIGEVSEDGDSATVEVTMTGDGESNDDSFDLVKADDEWKICGLMG